MEKRNYIQPTIETLPAEPDSQLLAASANDEEYILIYPDGSQQQPITDKTQVW